MNTESGKKKVVKRLKFLIKHWVNPPGMYPEKPVCTMCHLPIKGGQLVAQSVDRTMVHAGLHGEGLLCESVVRAVGCWDGKQVQRVDWSKLRRPF